MSDIWDTGSQDVCALGSEDSAAWEEDTPSTLSHVKSRKRKDHPTPASKQVYQLLDQDDEVLTARATPEVDDDLLLACLANTTKQKGQRSPSPLLGSEASGQAVQPSQPQATQLLSAAARAALENTRAMKELLEQTRQLVDAESDDDNDAEGANPMQPVLPGHASRPVEDLTLLDSDDDAGLLADPDTTAATAGANSRNEDVKLPLKFRTQGCEDVIVRVNPSEELQQAFNKFRQYVKDQGWGTVSKFVSPDGDKLTGVETPADLDLEAEDIVEVYL